jgi:hypothetical protein
MPVLPLVGSRMIVSGVSSPACCAASIMLSPMRSLTLPAWVEELQLGGNRRLCVAGDAVDAHQRRAPNQICDVIRNHHI